MTPAIDYLNFQSEFFHKTVPVLGKNLKITFYNFSKKKCTPPPSQLYFFPMMILLECDLPSRVAQMLSFRFVE